MAYREMTQEEIIKRIANGDLVVYVKEEYGYRYWYWFPDMSEDELMAYWEKCNIEQHYFSPAGLPGDMVPVPAEYFEGAGSEEEPDDYYDRAYSDKRSGVLLRSSFRSATDEEKEQMIADYDAWNDEFFPCEAMWSRGFRDENNWRAHIHMDDDSWLKRPGEGYYVKNKEVEETEGKEGA